MMKTMSKEMAAKYAKAVRMRISEKSAAKMKITLPKAPWEKREAEIARQTKT